MDFSKFSDANFDARDWINEAFRSPEALKNKEQHGANLVMKLQLFIQEVNKSLDDISTQIVQTMPKVIREIDAISQEAVLLKNKMQMVQRDVQKVEQDTMDTMESLLKLDAAKSRMLEVEKSLKEIDNWSTLTQGIEELFAGGNAGAIAEKLTAMQQSLANLSDKAPEYATRLAYLDQLKEHFVNVVSPSVVSAFSAKTLETVEYFVQMFGELGKLEDLQTYYQRCLKADVQRQWDALVQSEELPELPDVVNALYDVLLSSWFAEVKWIGQAFKSPGAIVCKGLRLALAGIEPTISAVILDRLVNYSSNQLGVLIALKQNVDNFSRSIETAFASATDVSRGEVDAFLQELYVPMKTYVLNYRQYQQSDLQTKLGTFNFDNVDVSRTAKSLLAAQERAFNDAQFAVESCQLLTNNFGFPSLLKSLENFLSGFTLKATKCLDQIFTRIDKSAEDWTQFQQLFELIQVAGTFFLRLKDLEDRLQASYAKIEHFASEFPGLTKTEGEEDGDTPKKEKLSAFDALLVSENTIRLALVNLTNKLGKKRNCFLNESNDKAARFNDATHRLISSVLKGPLDDFLRDFTTLPVWQTTSVGEALTSDLPSFSLVPQEYITKVGQYLMTFAHYLDPYLVEENRNICIALSNTQLSFVDKQVVESSERAVALWVEHLAKEFMHSYCDAVLNIHHLSELGTKQLITDMEYFSNVAEDLGLSPSPDLKNLKSLLQMKSADFAPQAKNFPAEVVAAVKEIRRLK